MKGLMAGVLVLAAVGLPACGGDDKNANTGKPGQGQCPPGQYFDGQFCQMQAAGAQPTAGPAPTVAPWAIVYETFVGPAIAWVPNSMIRVIPRATITSAIGEVRRRWNGA